MNALQNFTDQIDKVDTLETAYDVFRYLSDLSSAIGASNFSLVDLSDEDDKIASIATVNNWQPELIHIYDENNLSDRSPILDQMRVQQRALVVDIEKVVQQRSPEKSNFSVGLFRDFSMGQSINCPVNGRQKEQGGLIFSSDKLDLDRSNLPLLHILSTYVFDRLNTVSKPPKIEEDASLSGREIDCLSWTAHGKTSREIAVILEISEHTVTHYLSSACRKMDSVNRVQAVAKALRLGLIN